MELVMVVDRFFNNISNERLTVLGGVIECPYLKSGEDVEIETTENRKKATILEIKHYCESLDAAPKGMQVGLMFSGIEDLDFRVDELPANPYNPKVEVEEFINFCDEATKTHNVRIYR